VFVQDITALETAEVPQNQFYTELDHVLRKFGTPLSLDYFDWTPVKALLVASEPGYHFSDTRRPLGLAALMFRSAKWHSADIQRVIEYQCSSLGKFDNKWLESVYKCCSGRAPVDSVGRFRIIFPTMDSVMKSPLGPGAFGTIFCKSKDWSAPNSPRAAFRQCIAMDLPGRPLHMKIMTVWSTDATLLYYYVGSANFTPSAWGRYVKEGRQMLISNFELGVILDPAECPARFAYERPAEPYEPHDTPWTQDAF